MKSYDPPIKITIPVPSEIPPRRGRHSTGRYGGNLRIRCTDTEYDLVQQEAKELNLTISGFGRWCIIRIAAALRTHRLEESTADGVEVDDST